MVIDVPLVYRPSVLAGMVAVGQTSPDPYIVPHRKSKRMREMRSSDFPGDCVIARDLGDNRA